MPWVNRAARTAGKEYKGMKGYFSLCSDSDMTQTGIVKGHSCQILGIGHVVPCHHIAAAGNNCAEIFQNKLDSFNESAESQGRDGFYVVCLGETINDAH